MRNWCIVVDYGVPSIEYGMVIHRCEKEKSPAAAFAVLAGWVAVRQGVQAVAQEPHPQAGAVRMHALAQPRLCVGCGVHTQVHSVHPCVYPTHTPECSAMTCSLRRESSTSSGRSTMINIRSKRLSSAVDILRFSPTV